jgi:hypothetical protein
MKATRSIIKVTMRALMSSFLAFGILTISSCTKTPLRTTAEAVEALEAGADSDADLCRCLDLMMQARQGDRNSETVAGLLARRVNPQVLRRLVDTYLAQAKTKTDFLSALRPALVFAQWLSGNGNAREWAIPDGLAVVRGDDNYESPAVRQRIVQNWRQFITSLEAARR